MGHSFCRKLLAEVMKQVKVKVSKVEIESSWAYKNGVRSYEFHGPNNFYVHGLNADCIWSAKADGWMKYLDSL